MTLGLLARLLVRLGSFLTALRTSGLARMLSTTSGSEARELIRSGSLRILKCELTMRMSCVLIHAICFIRD